MKFGSSLFRRIQQRTLLNLWSDYAAISYRGTNDSACCEYESSTKEYIIMKTDILSTLQYGIQECYFAVESAIARFFA